MTIVYSGPAGQYASAAVSKRSGRSTSMEYTYLGKVLDREAGIYQNRERGVFTFDHKTGEYGTDPDSFVFPDCPGQNHRDHVSVDFGDSWFLNEFLWQSGLANLDAIHWYNGNIVRLLYPGANMTSQRLSDFLAAIGTPERQMAFQKAYITFVLEHYDRDKNILVDSCIENTQGTKSCTLGVSYRFILLRGFFVVKISRCLQLVTWVYICVVMMEL